jgi:ParB family transcriptional regulator, chromosome partitioning protein
MESKALGKGLSALIPEKAANLPIDLLNPPQSVAFLKTAKIKDNRLQPRLHYDEDKLADLIASIKEKGVLQPILVRESGDDFEVVAGERRLRAARALNLEEVPVIIKKVSDQEALVIALVENIQREELNPMEEAQAFRRLIDDFQLSQDDVAQAVGKDSSTVSNTLRLLKLPDNIQNALFEGRLTMGHARALLGVENAQEQQDVFALVISKGISVRELENIIRTGLKTPARRRKVKSLTTDHELVRLEEELQRILGTKVRLQAQKKRGKIVIEYYSLDDLDRILNIVRRR